MTDMDYEKKYKEALTWVESIYHELSHDRQMEAEAFFPELKESEDEKIRKEILSFCQGRADNYPNAPMYGNIRKWIAWLEKQGQKPYGQRKECLDCQFNYACECKGFCAMKRNEWKPTDEQIGVIEAVINNRSFQKRHLDSLYEQLKKLKEE